MDPPSSTGQASPQAAPEGAPTKAEKKKVKKQMGRVIEESLRAMSFEKPFNNGDVLPFALMEPHSQGKLVWVASRDEEERLISVFCYKDSDGTEEKTVKELGSDQEAISVRDDLVVAGWIPYQVPEPVLKLPDGRTLNQLNRKERRAMARQINNTKNPHQL